MIQREDGSIQSGDFVVTVDGKAIRNKDAKKDYVNAVSEKLKADHAKAVEEYNKKKAEEAAANVVEPQPIISEEDRAERDANLANQQKEQEKQTILAGIQQNKTKQGEIQMDKLTPEETLLVYQNEETPESLMLLLTEQLQYLRSQVAEIQNKDLSPIEKKNKTRKIQQSISAYEAAIEKWLGEEALATINAEPEVVPSVVPQTQEAAVEPVEEPANPDTTPLPLAEPEVEGTEVAESETPAPETLGEEAMPEAEQEIAGNEPVESEPVVEKPTANLDEVTVWVAKNYDYIVTDKDGNTIFSSKPTRKNVTDAFEELHQVEGKVDGKRGTYNGEDCIIVRDNPAKGYVNIVTPHGIERVGREEVMIDGKPLKGKASIVEWRENNEKMYGTFESIMSFPVFDIRGEMNITFLDFLNTRQDSPYVAFYDMLRKHYREKYNDDVAQQYLDASVSRLIENLKEVARLWNIVRLKNLVSSGQMPTALDKKKMELQSKRIKEAVAAVHNEVGMDNSITFSGLAKLSEKAAKKAEKKGEGEGYFAETDEEKAESFANGLVSNIVWVGFEDESRKEHKRAVDGIVEFLSRETKKSQKQRELVVKILNDKYEEAKRLNRLNDMQAIEKVIDRISSVKKFKSLLTEVGLIKDNSKKADIPATQTETAQTLTEQEEVSVEPVQVEMPAAPVENKTTVVAEEKEKTKDADTLKAEIEELNERLNNLNEEQEDEFDSILAQIQEKNAELERLGKGYKEERTSGKSSRGIFDNYASDDSMSLERADYMIGDTVVEHAESTKRIIKILKDAGIRVVTFKNEDLPKYVNKKKLEELSDGQIVYGFASNDTIYLNEDHFNPNSPLHEFTHLWVTAYKQAFAKEWQRFVEIANKSALAANLRKPLKDGKASPYAELSADEMASEVLSRYTGYLYGELDADGRTAFENMMQAQTMEENIAEKSLLNRIRNIWKKIISWFDKSIEKEKKEDVIDVAIRNFASKPMETLAQGREAVNELKQLAEQGYKVQSTYHGTSVEFDQFDNDFMSTGEGAQAYGWGIYVSQVKDIGVSYAKQDADRKNKTIDFTNYPTVLVDVAVKDYLENADIKNGVRESVDDYIAKLRKQEKEFVEQFIQAAVQLKGYSFIKRDLEGTETFKELTKKLYKLSVSIGDITWESEYALEYRNKAEEVSNRISWLQMLTESDKRKAQEHEAFRDRHLYEVNIPADSYLEDGSIDLENSPYIGFDDEYTAGSKMFKLAELFFQERMDEFAKNELQVFMDKHGIEGDAKDFITLAYNDDVSRTLDNEAKNERKRLADYYGKLKFLRNGYAQSKSDNPLYDLVRTGGEIYDQIASILGSQKDATEWFLYNGIIGVRVSTHATSGKKRDTKNYVIFNEADAHIVNHTAFMIGED
jgi:hypothetical protein